MMNRINYQRRLDQIIEQIANEKEKEGSKLPRLFLHSCCAPCSSYVLEYLSDYFLITDFFYNPNIWPPEEFDKREVELKRLIDQMPLGHHVEFRTSEYDPRLFFDAVKGLEEIPEGGERCFACYRLRMEETARLAAQGGYDYFTTTLSISPLKNADKINEIGEELEKKYGVKHLPSDFKKRGGYLRSTVLSKEYDLYRQDYCGCVFSQRERAALSAERSAQNTERAAKSAECAPQNTERAAKSAECAPQNTERAAKSIERDVKHTGES